MDSIHLREVGIIDAVFLYDLLKNRDPSANISHRKMPPFWKHCNFILSKPYSAWYIIKNGNRKIGACYLSKQNEIGVALTKGNQGLGYGKQALGLLMQLNPRERYIANIAPHNGNSLAFFEKRGFKLIQMTFSLEAETI